MMTLTESGLVCPACQGALEMAADEITCCSCRRRWAVNSNVPCFISDAPYWGELSEEKMRRLLEDMQNQPWRNVMSQSDDPDFARVYDFIANTSRANWQYLLPAGPQLRALDIGAGMGTISHALAARYGKVYALEQVDSRIEFMRRRFAQDGVANVQLIRSSFTQMPFPNNFFDLVVLNGVLEWLPLEQPHLQPRQAQAEALAKIFSLLRPGGHLYLGIENRILPGYFIGYNDPHCGIPFVTVLPRPLANWLAKKKTGKPYQNYLYSANGYRRLLRKSGFHEIKIFAAETSYNFPFYITPIRTPAYRFYFDNFCERPQRFFKRLLQTIAKKLGVLGDLGYAFIILGQKA